MTPLVQIKINKNYDYVKYDPFGATVNAFILDVYESQTEPNSAEFHRQCETGSHSTKYISVSVSQSCVFETAHRL